MRRFDSQLLETQLSKVTGTAQAAFSLACALRISRQGAEPHLLAGHARSVVLQSLNTLSAPAPETASILCELEASAELDQDSVAASYYALACLARQDLKSAVWAARRAYDAADAAAQEAIGSSSFSPEVEAALLAHPLVQRELSDQAQDLALLREHPERAMVVVIRASEA